MAEVVLLGDEAVALGAIHSGITAAYSYPGTPATEIMEYLLAHTRKHGNPHAAWTANEKTAYEEALGTSIAGRRALVSMKHVGLNVAADPFMNSAIVRIHGGLVVAVADDPGMHSSQNEQDSRAFADMARILCLEPANQQEAYEMTRTAFDLSEELHIPVMIRLVTRLAHSRAVVKVREGRPENPMAKAPVASSWILLPSNARNGWKDLLSRQSVIRDRAASIPFTTLEPNDSDKRLGVITTGIARNYYVENSEELAPRPSHLHVSAYPLPIDKIRALVDHVETVLVLEEGYPFLERSLRGILPLTKEIRGKESGHLPTAGELTPEIVRAALGLPARTGVVIPGLSLPNRPPQLCPGCPHCDTFSALKKALSGYETSIVTADIGCYTLGALPPYSAIESCVCMGASVSMAKGASEAGLKPAVAVIGDSTFLHSGITPLMDAVSANTPLTLIILDNQAVAMTGGQKTLLESPRLEGIVRGIGVDPEHLRVVKTHPKEIDRNAEVIRRELDYPGVSVIIAVRECIETAKKKNKAKSEVAR